MHAITTKANLTRVRSEDLKDAWERPLVGSISTIEERVSLKQGCAIGRDRNNVNCESQLSGDRETEVWRRASEA